ncbi:phosphotransferase [Pseudoalteromonas tunicata]|uniref:phosphotransferase n=1 Tax=Pseudoalteromonas tunicata TaxID=314281 RepID=UPI00273E1420|nr:phosphotransferase [Pseudoalteromonas tunicata]MDP5211693.1 phosphotransferase [Pseudoalteromonas tunicata]
MHPLKFNHYGPFPDALLSVTSQLLPNEQLQSAQYLKAGLSNANYWLKTNKQEYLLKFYQASFPQPQLAMQQHLASLGLCPDVIKSDLKANLALFDFMPGENPKMLEFKPLLKLLSQLHQQQSNSPTLSFTDYFAQYSTLNYYAEFSTLIDNLLENKAKFEATPGYCHNDLLINNIIVNRDKNETKWFLIDFEYAANNDVFFDLAALCCDFKLEENSETDLLHYYLSHNRLKIDLTKAKAKLHCFKLIYCLLCYFWYASRQLQPEAGLTYQQIQTLLLLKS